MIETIALCKDYGKIKAVDHLDLKIQSGELYGFLGPNGAGKTTTLMMILGILKPSSGQVHIMGKPLAKEYFQIKRQIGVVAEYQNFYDDMTAWEYLLFFARIFKVEDAPRRAQELLERLNLWQWRDVMVGGFSTGMQRKLGFARALIHQPKILVLDEPVSGLDPFGIVQVREMLQELHASGTTILVSSHILSEIERTATRVGIISKGQLIYEGPLELLKAETGGNRRIEIEMLNPSPELIADIKNLPFVSSISPENGHFLIVTTSNRDYRLELGQFLADRRMPIQGMRTLETSLEEAFITITEQHVRDWAQKQPQAK